METEISPEQKAQLTTWSGKRDSLLSEISNLENQKEKLGGEVKNLSASLTDIEARKNQIIGAIEELAKREGELYFLTPKEVVDLRVEKSSLQTEVASLKYAVIELSVQKTDIQRDILLGAEVLKVMNDKAGLLEKVVGDTTEANRANISMVDGLVSKVKESLEEVIKSTNKVVNETNFVIKELPGVFLDVKRQSLERKVIKKHK